LSTVYETIIRSDAEVSSIFVGVNVHVYDALHKVVVIPRCIALLVQSVLTRCRERRDACATLQIYAIGINWWLRQRFPDLIWQ
jgi:hypothetical protein